MHQGMQSRLIVHLVECLLCPSFEVSTDQNEAQAHLLMCFELRLKNLSQYAVKCLSEASFRNRLHRVYTQVYYKLGRCLSIDR